MRINNPTTPEIVLLAKVKKQLANARIVGWSWNSDRVMPLNKTFEIKEGRIIIKSSIFQFGYYFVTDEKGEIVPIKTYYPKKAIKRHKIKRIFTT